MTVLVTGSTGFIGANFVFDWLALHDEPVVSLDKLTYADNRQNLASLDGDVRRTFVAGGIGDNRLVARLLAKRQPRTILSFAVESHVNRSVHGSEDSIQTNTVDTFRLLEEVHVYWDALEPEAKVAFRFLHVSTGEVYDSLAPSDPAFTKNNRCKLDSLYPASKAASDRLVRAYHHTYGLPTLTANCSNNYGPYHFPGELIPLVIHNTLTDKPLPIYGNDQQVHGWLYVKDHCSAIRWILEARQLGETYDVGGQNGRANLDAIETLYAVLD